jgi:hypothetical protein
MLFAETVAVYCQNHTEHMSTLCGQNVNFINITRMINVVSHQCAL